MLRFVTLVFFVFWINSARDIGAEVGFHTATIGTRATIDGFDQNVGGFVADTVNVWINGGWGGH
ncbi:hypothetical protein ACI4CU_27820, partial [Klebsiella pneumoniae]|uniref:hypothetical protein n=1 Tax=Klebsiella pneumoniae TaxID=573 RepID=UPI003852D99A